MSITVTVTPPAGDPIVLDPIGAEGATGTNGWTPVIAIEYDGARAVHKIVDWGGGEGIYPPVGQYVALNGTFVSDIADAADIRGPQGLQGPQGNPGLILTSGSIFTGDGVPNDADGVDNDIYIDNLTADLYQKQSGTWVLQTNIKGAKGDKGDQGDRGVAGVAGTNGATILIGTGVPASGVGANGDIYVEEITFTLYRKSGGAWSVVGVFKGASGNTIRVASGAPSNGTGMDGDSYVDSANGDLYVRTAGTYTVVGNLKGPQGNDGAQGVQGVQGPSGASTLFGSGAPASGLGSNGDSYIDTVAFNLYTKSGGAWTNQGSLKGANGEDGIGNAIFTGPGAPGTIPTSIAGDIYINTTNGDVYQKVGTSFGSPIMNMRGPQGDQGPQGSQGIQGTPGAAGTSILAGNGVPNGATGNNGDLYINKLNGDFFGPKASGSWPSSTLNLKGVRGSIWYAGAESPPGAQSGQLNGDYYMVTGTGQVWQLVSGTWADQGFAIKGPAGASGAPGATGTLWFTGTSFPTIPPAREGDLFFNTSTNLVYQVTGSSWGSAIADLTGDSGPAGTDGTNGTNGTNGWTPVISVVSDGTRRVMQIVDWVGGTGTEPSSTNQYIGASGIVSSAAAAVDVRGPAGADGAQGPAGPSNLPMTSVSAARTITASDKGTCLYHPAADTTARVWTINNDAAAPNAWTNGDTITFLNHHGAGNITIAISGSGAVLRQVGTTNTGSRTLAPNGMATAFRANDGLTWYINGSGLS